MTRMAIIASIFVLIAGCATSDSVVIGDQQLAVARITARAAGTAIAMEDLEFADKANRYCDKILEVEDTDVANSLALAGLKLLGEKYVKYGVFIEDVQDLMIVLGFNLEAPESLDYPLADLKSLVKAFRSGLTRGTVLMLEES